jgi:hypothetical protein
MNSETAGTTPMEAGELLKLLYNLRKSREPEPSARFTVKKSDDETGGFPLTLTSSHESNTMSIVPPTMRAVILTEETA